MGLLFSSYRHSSHSESHETNINVDNTLSPKAIEESRKLIKEAEKNIIKHVVLQDNVFNGVLIAFSNISLSASPCPDITLRFKFSLNNIKYEFEEIVSYDYFKFKGLESKDEYTFKKAALEVLIPKVAELLSIEMIKNLKV